MTGKKEIQFLSRCLFKSSISGLDLSTESRYNKENRSEEGEATVTDRQLRCFLALYETLNFSDAARKLFLTQPTLSYQIRALETELGTVLFERTTCYVKPTRAGDLFAGFAQSTQMGYEAFRKAVTAAEPPREKLVLQVPAVMAKRDPLYNDLLMALRRELPDYELEVRAEESMPENRETLQPEVDAAIGIRRKALEPDVEAMPLFGTKCYLLASPENPLHALEEIHPQQLAGQTICYEPCDARFATATKRMMEDVPVHWKKVASFQKEYLRMLEGGCLFLSPIRMQTYPKEWFRTLVFPFPPIATCLFTRKGDMRHSICILKELALKEHARAVADGRL